MIRLVGEVGSTTLLEGYYRQPGFANQHLAISPAVSHR
jgi:hypothetical protein